MIGKIMSEAAHSIIGMLSAKPVGMERNPSNSDFGSLLRSAEEQSSSGNGDLETDVMDMANIGSWDGSAVIAQNWAVPNVPTFANFSLGNMKFGPGSTSQSSDQGQAIFGQDRLVGSDLSDTVSVSDQEIGEAITATTGVGSEILSRQSNVLSDSGYQIDKVPELGVADIADAGLAGNDAESNSGRDIVDGSKRRNNQPLTAEEFQLQSRVRENIAGEGASPSSDKAHLKRQNLQTQMSRKTVDFIQPSADALKSMETESSASPAANSEAGKQAATFTLPDFKGGEQRDSRSDSGQSGSRSTSKESSQDVTTGLSKLNMIDDEFAGLTKLDLQSATKSLEASLEAQPIANPVAQPIGRDMMRRAGSFDLTAPQVAERLAAEIADVSTSGGAKTFEINPRNLGRMEISFTTRGSIEIIEIQTEHRAAKDMIVQHSQLLQDILKSQGRDDLTLRVDVKESNLTSTRTDGGSLSQQENRDAREQQARPSQRNSMVSTVDYADENGQPTDNSRYA